MLEGLALLPGATGCLKQVAGCLVGGSIRVLPAPTWLQCPCCTWQDRGSSLQLFLQSLLLLNLCVSGHTPSAPLRMTQHCNYPLAPLWPQPCCSPVQIMEMCLRTGAIRNTKAFLGEMMPLAFQLTGEEPPVVVAQTWHVPPSSAAACMLACWLQQSLSGPCQSVAPQKM